MFKRSPFLSLPVRPTLEGPTNPPRPGQRIIVRKSRFASARTALRYGLPWVALIMIGVYALTKTLEPKFEKAPTSTSAAEFEEKRKMTMDEALEIIKSELGDTTDYTMKRIERPPEGYDESLNVRPRPTRPAKAPPPDTS
eukprot:g20106.t1